MSAADGVEEVRDDAASEARSDADRREADPRPAAQAKLDPETFELRARPQRVARFRRGLLIAAAAGLASAIAAVAWLALAPIELDIAGDASDPFAAAAISAPPEVLAGLPDDYGGDIVPRLGPPLPGDLGPAILAHQRDMAIESGAPELAPDPAEQAAIAARERRLAEIEHARAAPVLMEVLGDRGPSGRSTDPPRPPVSAAGALAGADASAAATVGVSAARIRAPASRWQISAGSVIPASLITGLNSDIPGMVVAQVTEPVFDSASGRTVLVPQGARLLGRYDSRIAFGQRRAMLVWERLVMPDGSSLALDNAPATDAAGYAGIADSVDFHTWRLLEGVGLSSLLGVGTEMRFGRARSGLVEALRDTVQTNADRTGQRLVERNLDIAPTIIVRPGFPVRVLVHKDLVLPPWEG